MSVVVGLTGGIGSGKSSVARMFEKLGATIVDADAIVHKLQAPGMPLLRELALAFGEHLIDESGALDRKSLGEIVFRDEAQRRRLNLIVHPAVGAECLKRVAIAREAGASLIVVDIPLLFEGKRAGTGTASMMDFDVTVVVWVPEELQVERAVRRDGSSREAVLQRVRSQISLDEKRELADHLIDNSGAVAATQARVEALFRELSAMDA